MKAYLLYAGMKDRDLRGIGHDLARLWGVAGECGLQLEQPAPFWVQVLGLAHDSPYIYRYPREGVAAAIPAADELLAQLSSVLDVVDRTIKQAKPNEPGERRKVDP